MLLADRADFVIAGTLDAMVMGPLASRIPIAIVEPDAVLRVWRDANGNGVTDKGELLTLAQAGVKDISLNKTSSGVDNSGNRIDFTGSFTRTNEAGGYSVAVSFSFNQTLAKCRLQFDPLAPDDPPVL